MDHKQLSGTDERAPLRRKSWEALANWISSRVGRQRGVHVPNLFQISWRLVATDDSGSKLRRPVFVLSERFAENFGVKQGGYVETGVPAPAQGDDVNFYQLAIQHSEGLTKDQAFSMVRDMVFRFGEAASQGKELRLNLGAGHLVVKEKEVSFDFSASGNAGGGGGDGGEREKLSHLDPMLNGRRVTASGLLDTLSMSGSRLSGGSGRVPVSKGGGGGSSGSALGGKGRGGGGGSALGGGGSVLSAEEEAALFADVDALDPETIALGGATAKGAELEAPTKAQVSAALKLDVNAVADQTVEELGAALGARAAALEAQLAASRHETDAIEARLRKASSGAGGAAAHKDPGRDAARGAAKIAAEEIKRDRRVQIGSAKLLPLENMGSPGSDGSPIAIGALSVSGSGSGAVKPSAARTGGGAAAKRAGGAQGGGAGGGRMADVGPSLLSVGFSAEGPGGAAHLAPLTRQVIKEQPAPPVISARMSDTASEGARSRGSKVPVAPPLPPFRFARYEPNDAANKAWKQHAAPNAAREHKVKPVAIGGRSVGGPAPPFLAAPPVVAAQSLAARQGP